MVRPLLHSWREQELSPERRFSTQGEIKRCCEKYALSPEYSKCSKKHKPSRINKNYFLLNSLTALVYPLKYFLKENKNMQMVIGLTFPGQLKDDSVICSLCKQFEINLNILEASFSTYSGWAILGIEGSDEELKKVFEFLKNKSINIQIVKNNEMK
ncbi:MAG: NIL domain-containing protein [Candidatus Omnitrophica bacterium]|nr:NIL domain-containing protein [Candidatus Omnitrophota bacterium]